MVYAWAVVSDIRSRFSRRGPKIIKTQETDKDIYPRVYVDALVIIAKYIPPLCCMTVLPRYPWESPSYTVIGKTSQPPPSYSVGVVWVPHQTWLWVIPLMRDRLKFIRPLYQNQTVCKPLTLNGWWLKHPFLETTVTDTPLGGHWQQVLWGSHPQWAPKYSPLV